jgi:hypothetical protein
MTESDNFPTTHEHAPGKPHAHAGGNVDHYHSLSGKSIQVASLVETAEPRKLCDHICMLDADHVERGELHQYCYENPPPRPVGRGE